MNHSHEFKHAHKLKHALEQMLQMHATFTCAAFMQLGHRRIHSKHDVIGMYH